MRVMYEKNNRKRYLCQKRKNYMYLCLNNNSNIILYKYMCTVLYLKKENIIQDVLKTNNVHINII